MSYHVLIIKTDGTIVKTVQLKKPTYEQQKAAVGGFIETIPYFTKMSYQGIEYVRGTAYVDEEGRLKGKPLNKLASACWMTSCPKGDPSRMLLCGDVIFYAKVKD
jgi:hypothetical protein